MTKVLVLFNWVSLLKVLRLSLYIGVHGWSVALVELVSVTPRF